MRYLDQLVKQTQKAVDDICRAAQAVPADRVEWSPGGHARSTLSQMKEVATQSSWFLPLIRDRQEPGGRDSIDAAMHLSDGLSEVSQCVELARSSTADLCQAIAAFPESSLDEEVVMPFGEGMRMSMADVLALPYWNLVYHLGQINQIQLMLGDRDMH